MKKETGYNNMKLTSNQVDELIKNSCEDSTYSLLIDNGFFELANYVKENNINKGKLFNELMIKGLKITHEYSVNKNKNSHIELVKIK